MTSYVFLANGFEEVEAMAPVDIMRRAGLDVKTVSINPSHQVAGAHNVVIKADLTFAEVEFDNADWLVLPGGMPGAENLYNHDGLRHLLKQHVKKGRIAAICASPAVVTGQLGLLENRNATCYPSFGPMLTQCGALYDDTKRVVTDGNIVTANGPASALLFGLEIVRLSAGNQVAEQIAKDILY